MSDPENFVARWSRLKRETAKESKETEARHPGLQPEDAEEETKVAPLQAGKPPEPAFDPASLPPIESITAGSDIRAFLQSGVPAELTKAALRRAWTTDPAIRDFIGLAENQWDFTDPTAMPGFGPLEATDDVRQLVSQAMGKLGELSEASVQPTGHATPTLPPASGVQCDKPVADQPRPGPGIQAPGIPARNRIDPQVTSSAEEQNRVDAASQHEPAPAESGAAPNRRGHGRALPQ